MRKKETEVKKEFKTVAYLRVSTDTQNLEKDKSGVLAFANEHNLGRVHWIEETASGAKAWKERKLYDAIMALQPGDKLIVTELSRLGRSLLEIMEILSILKQRDVAVYDIKNKWSLNGSIESKVLAMAFSIAAEIERDLISKRTKEALRVRKEKGVKLGRPQGPGKSKLDPYKEEIISMLKTGVSKAHVARKYNCTALNLRNWIEKNGLVEEVKPQ
ncbi:MAG: recombinase family protein [Desulfatiglans sp.]|nr:recombinase family protein [Desulfatiglans sp.]